MPINSNICTTLYTLFDGERIKTQGGFLFADVCAFFSGFVSFGTCFWEENAKEIDTFFSFWFPERLSGRTRAYLSFSTDPGENNQSQVESSQTESNAPV